MTETRALSYREIAKAFDITVPSARNMVRRRMWHRMPSNDPKTVRVLVPVEEIPVRWPKPDAARDASSDGPSENRAASNGVPDDARDGSSGGTSEALARLAKHIETLQAELDMVRTEATRAAALDVTLAALSATLEAVTCERDRLADQVKAALARHATVPSVVATPTREWRWPFRRRA